MVEKRKYIKFHQYQPPGSSGWLATCTVYSHMGMHTYKLVHHCYRIQHRDLEYYSSTECNLLTLQLWGSKLYGKHEHKSRLQSSGILQVVNSCNIALPRTTKLTSQLLQPSHFSVEGRLQNCEEQHYFFTHHQIFQIYVTYNFLVPYPCQ